MSGKCRSPDLFVPFGFVVGGALGEKAEWLMRECRAVAEWRNRGVGELAGQAHSTVPAPVGCDGRVDG